MPSGQAPRSAKRLPDAARGQTGARASPRHRHRRERKLGPSTEAHGRALAEAGVRLAVQTRPASTNQRPYGRLRRRQLRLPLRVFEAPEQQPLSDARCGDDAGAGDWSRRGFRFPRKARPAICASLARRCIKAGRWLCFNPATLGGRIPRRAGAAPFNYRVGNLAGGHSQPCASLVRSYLVVRGNGSTPTLRPDQTTDQILAKADSPRPGGPMHRGEVGRVDSMSAAPLNCRAMRNPRAFGQ